MLSTAPHIPPTAQHWPWPNFTRAEMACRHCGESYDWPEFMTRLQAMRDDIRRPLRILSAHRCRIHNARIGGAPLSQHLRLAADIALAGHDRHRLYAAAKRVGFTGFGLYASFLHIDLGRARQWYGPGNLPQQLWQK